MTITVGFTGTREGMSENQLDQFCALLQRWRMYPKEAPEEFHHGDCVGADAQAHDLIREAQAAGMLRKLRIVIHPSYHKWLRAYKSGDSMREPLAPLARNRHIVEVSDLLIAAPSGPEVLRSGTWATVRYARRRLKDKRQLIAIHILPRGE